jgi:hypothetical protein
MLELCLFFKLLVEFLRRHEVFIITVIVVALADLFVNLVNLLLLLSFGLLLLNSFKSVQIWLLRLNPAALVTNDVLMVEL